MGPGDRGQHGVIDAARSMTKLQRVWKRHRRGSRPGLDVTVDGWQGALPMGVRPRDGRQQDARIRVARVAENVRAGADLDDAAEIHDRDTVGDMLHDGQIVGDER